MNGTAIKYDQIRSRLGAGNVQDAIDNLVNASVRVVSDPLSTRDDLDNVFEEGLYTYTNTCANIPYAMQTSNTYAGRLIVLHTSDAHIIQIALPNQRYYDIYMRHYSSINDEYAWSIWYPLSFDTYKMSLSDVPYGYLPAYILKYCDKTLNPTQFPNSTFEITAVSRNGYSAKFTVVLTSTKTESGTTTSATVTRIDGNSASIHPDVRKTQSNNIFVRMIDDAAETQPGSTEAIDIYVVKIR